MLPRGINLVIGCVLIIFDMEIIGELSHKAKKAIARGTYSRYRNERKESKAYIAILFAMCNGTCPKCGQKMILSFDDKWNNRGYSATLDHIMPLSMEVDQGKMGLQIMCRRCNLEKADKLGVY